MSEKRLSVQEVIKLARAVLHNSPLGRRDDELQVLAREVIEANEHAATETADAVRLKKENDALRAAALTSEEVEALEFAKHCVQHSLTQMRMSVAGHGLRDVQRHQDALSALDRILAAAEVKS